MRSNTIPLLSEENKNSLVKILNTKYAAFLEGRFFELELGTEYELALVKVTLRDSQNRFFYPVEGRISFKEQDLSAKDAVLFLIDYIDFYFDEFFNSNGDVLLPIDWSKHTFEEKDFQIKGQIFNLEREQLADEWLKKSL